MGMMGISGADRRQVMGSIDDADRADTHAGIQLQHLLTTTRTTFQVLHLEKDITFLTSGVTAAAFFRPCTHFSSPLPLKHVQVRQGLERADAVRIRPDDLLVVEEDPRVTVTIPPRADVGDIVARVDGRAFVRDEGPEAVTRGQRGRSGERRGRSVWSCCCCCSSFVFLARVIRMRE